MTRTCASSTSLPWLLTTWQRHKNRGIRDRCSHGKWQSHQKVNSNIMFLGIIYSGAFISSFDTDGSDYIFQTCFQYILRSRLSGHYYAVIFLYDDGYILIQISLKCVPRWSRWQRASISSDYNVLMLNWRQTIIRTNGGLVKAPHMLFLNELL